MIEALAAAVAARRPQGQDSDVHDTPPTCPQSWPAQCGACQAFVFSAGSRWLPIFQNWSQNGKLSKTRTNQKGSDLGSFIFFFLAAGFRAPLSPFQPLYKLFSCSKFPWRRRDTQCAARAPIGRSGRRRGVSSFLCAARPRTGLEAGLRAAREGRFPAACPASSGLGSRRRGRAPQARVPSAAVGGDPGKTWCSPWNPLIHCELGFHRGLTLKPASLLPHCLPPRVSYFSHLLHVDLNIWVLGKEVGCFRTPP
ncbi:uncharacterized protein LOC109490133 [Ailuropoda melanoleuca]|uniref:uncharacterized protein LOC109490133 n=1 Tax=Ailuropoda melanoleuca TaxID=9646 RepID=UPI0014948473|nr:uncharacterized protein LOC109490133 [Ailuropoda melanoleuca]